MQTLGGGGTQDLILSKEGTGTAVLPPGSALRPTDLQLDPLDMGFVVQRRYEAVDDPEDVYQDEDGVWHIKAGARVRVRLTMVADNRRYHVALVDPLPAGLEIVNPALAVSGSTPQDPDSAELPLRLVVVGHLVRAPEPARRARRGLHLPALGWGLRLHLYRPRHHTRSLRRPACQGRRDVLAGGVRSQRQRCGDRRIGGRCSLRAALHPCECSFINITVIEGYMVWPVLQCSADAEVDEE